MSQRAGGAGAGCGFGQVTRLAVGLSETNYVAGGRLELVIATLSGEAEFVGGGGYLMIIIGKLSRSDVKLVTLAKAPRTRPPRRSLHPWPPGRACTPAPAAGHACLPTPSCVPPGARPDPLASAYGGRN